MAYVRGVRPEKEVSADRDYQAIAQGVNLVLAKDASGKPVAHKWVLDSNHFKSEAEADRWFSGIGKSPDTWGREIEAEVANWSSSVVKQKQVSSLSKASGSIEATSEPTDEQMDKINALTRTTKSKEDVAVFPVLACNSLVDRDDDVFKPETIDQFLALEGDNSFVGKSFLMDHRHQYASAIGRIFDVEKYEFEQHDPLTGKTKQVGVKEYIYIPRTEKYADIIQDIDFGILWAVSVGVSLNKSTCPIDDTQMSSFWFFGAECEQGHMKGFWYDPEEKDAKGNPVPHLEAGEGRQFAYMQYEDPVEGMETSAVWLGAQYGARIASKATKGAKLLSEVVGTPGNFVGLSASDTKILMSSFGNSANDNTDPSGAKGSPEPVPFLKENDQPAEGGEMDFTEITQALLKKGITSRHVSAAELAAVTTAESPEQLADALSKVITSADEAVDKAATEVSELKTKNTELTKDAELGAEWRNDKIAEIRKNYPLALAADPTSPDSVKAVNMTFVDKLIENSRNSPDLLKGLADSYKEQAQARLPKAVRRSSFPEAEFLGRGVGDDTSIDFDMKDPAVARIHAD